MYGIFEGIVLINNGGLSMWRYRVLSLVVGLLSLISFNVQAEATTTTIVEKRVIVTPAPKAVCSTVAGHWKNNVWVDAHNICKYDNRTEGVAWVSDYWSCTEAVDDKCTAWSLIPGHWVKTLEE